MKVVMTISYRLEGDRKARVIENVTMIDGTEDNSLEPGATLVLFVEAPDKPAKFVRIPRSALTAVTLDPQ